MDLAHLQQWIGRTEQLDDQITVTPVVALSATLDREDPAPRAGDALPPLWHWLYFLPMHRQSELGEDGHASRGGFLPPVPLPRRMWAGGRLTFHQPIPVGGAISRKSTVADIKVKEGRTGTLAFVLVQHEISGADGTLLTEEHDIVYRDNPRPGDPVPQPQAAPQDAQWTREIAADATLLFRYSALTFNGHRIHYDHPYVTEVEGYPGLVVHGPLIATLLVDLLRRNLPEAVLKQFSFKAVRPTFTPQPFRVSGAVDADGKTVRLWAQDHEGWLTMTATAEIA